MATRGENCHDWPRTVMTGGCLLVAFAPDGATGNDDELERFKEGCRIGSSLVEGYNSYCFLLVWC